MKCINARIAARMNEMGFFPIPDKELADTLESVFCERHVLIVVNHADDVMHGEWYVVNPRGRIGKFCKQLLKQHGTSC